MLTLTIGHDVPVWARGKNTHPPLENATARECNGCNAREKQRLCGCNGCMQVQRLPGSATACNAWEKQRLDPDVSAQWTANQATTRVGTAHYEKLLALGADSSGRRPGSRKHSLRALTRTAQSCSATARADDANKRKRRLADIGRCSDDACHLCETIGHCKQANDGPGPGCTWHAIDDHPDGHDKGGHPNRGVCTSNKPSNEL